jgi:3-(3-hydroxy-phenyl)propionate hydroxylase
MLSGRDFAILEALGAQFIALNPLGPIKIGRTSVLECSDPRFIAWAGKHSVRGILVRPDRFIAARLGATGDLAVLTPFASATGTSLPKAA